MWTAIYENELCVFPEVIPEWNTDDMDELGTFDANGAFMSLKVGVIVGRERHNIFS